MVCPGTSPVAADIWVESQVPAQTTHSNRSSVDSVVSKTSSVSSRVLYADKVRAGPYTRKVRDLRSGPKEVLVKLNESKPKEERTTHETESIDRYEPNYSVGPGIKDLDINDWIQVDFADDTAYLPFSFGPVPSAVTPTLEASPVPPLVTPPPSPTRQQILIYNTSPLEVPQKEEKEETYCWASVLPTIPNPIVQEHPSHVIASNGVAIQRTPFYHEDSRNPLVTWSGDYPRTGGGTNILGFEEDFVFTYQYDREAYDLQIAQLRAQRIVFKREQYSLVLEIEENNRWYTEETRKFEAVHGNIALDEENQPILLSGYYLQSRRYRVEYLLSAIEEALLRDEILTIAEWHYENDAGSRLAQEVADRIIAKGGTHFYLPLALCRLLVSRHHLQIQRPLRPSLVPLRPKSEKGITRKFFPPPLVKLKTHPLKPGRVTKELITSKSGAAGIIASGHKDRIQTVPSTKQRPINSPGIPGTNIGSTSQRSATTKSNQPPPLPQENSGFDWQKHTNRSHTTST